MYPIGVIANAVAPLHFWLFFTRTVIIKKSMLKYKKYGLVFEREDGLWQPIVSLV